MSLPTPTCTNHQSTIISCLICRGAMRLSSIEPGARNFELRRYLCASCETEESFLMSLAAALPPVHPD